jgi:cytoskeletal protein RodZ
MGVYLQFDEKLRNVFIVEYNRNILVKIILSKIGIILPLLVVVSMISNASILGSTNALLAPSSHGLFGNNLFSTTSLAPSTQTSPSTTTSLAPSTQTSPSTTTSLAPSTQTSPSTTTSLAPSTQTSPSTTTSLAPSTQTSPSTTTSKVNCQPIQDQYKTAKANYDYWTKLYFSNPGKYMTQWQQALNQWIAAQNALVQSGCPKPV